MSGSPYAAPLHNCKYPWLQAPATHSLAQLTLSRPDRWLGSASPPISWWDDDLLQEAAERLSSRVSLCIVVEGLGELPQSDRTNGLSGFADRVVVPFRNARQVGPQVVLSMLWSTSLPKYSMASRSSARRNLAERSIGSPTVPFSP